jgi:succinyl-CoA synthetase alpha subunit
MEALQCATIRVVAVIAEGVPEKDTKRMIAYARANNKVIIGPATVGGVQVRRECVCVCVCVCGCVGGWVGGCV